MISTEAEEPISRRNKTGARFFPGVRRAWLCSVVVHSVVLVIVVVLALHPGKVLAPRNQGDSSQVESSVLRASLVSRLPHSLSTAAQSVPMADKAPADTPDRPLSTYQRKAKDHSAAPMIPPKQSKSKAASSPPVVKTAPRQQRDSGKARAPIVEPKVDNSMAQHKPGASESTQESLPVSSTEPVTTSAPDRDIPGKVHSGEPLLVAARYAGTPQQADYPALARRLGQQGRVVVEVWLDAKGEQEKRLVIESSGHASLDRAALAAVARNSFLPYSQNGRALPSRLRVPIEFKLLAR